MVNNNLFLLDELIAEQQSGRSTPLQDNEAFEFFASEQALRSQALSPEEVESGIVGGSGDGGIDGIYVFLNDELLSEDSEIFEDSFSASSIQKGSPLLIWTIQAKREESFSETAFDKVSHSIDQLLDLKTSEESLQKLYSPELIERVLLFRNAIQKFATRFLKTEIKFTYASRGQTNLINEKVREKARLLEESFRGLFPDSFAEVEFLGSDELMKLAKSIPSYTLELPYQQDLTSGNSHIGLVSLENYYNFISEDNKLRRHIFDWNVRDYQGEVEVNNEIKASLTTSTSTEFWWLNNGVTVITSRAVTVGQKYILEDVQIVNGLQTSHTIFRVFKDLAADHSSRSQSVLVRILVTEDSVARDKVIRATNRQTTVPEASLRATDQIQRSIETYFLAKDWYYDRRKNYYRNLGKSSQRIVSIPLLAQAVMSMGLGQPNDSRARPSSLLKNASDYERIFSDKIDIKVYLWLAQAQREVDEFLLTASANSNTQERTNLRFHLAMLSVWEKFGERIYSPAQLATKIINFPNISSTILLSTLIQLRSLYTIYETETGDTGDKIAKSQGFVDHIVKDFVARSSKIDDEATLETGVRPPAVN